MTAETKPDILIGDGSEDKGAMREYELFYYISLNVHILVPFLLPFDGRVAKFNNTSGRGSDKKKCGFCVRRESDE